VGRLRDPAAAAVSRIAVVTGAASGIGAATARRLAVDGYELCLVDRAEEALGHLAASLDANWLAADVTEPGAAERVLDQAGGADVLVTAAGAILRRTAEETSDADWDAALALNLTATFRFCRAAVPAMRARGGGAIVTVGSGWGLVAGPRAVAYAATKAAVVNLTRALAIDHGADRIRANCVCPGDTDTPLLHDELAQLGEDAASGIAASGAGRPLGRVAQPTDIAAAIAWLASPEARHVTGTTLVVDGGGLAGG
jgi:NAD(P)-dependent dehydrogenase (short-subunit alcohol dehydrogenase family)